jgi:hypothetical protein
MFKSSKNNMKNWLHTLLTKVTKIALGPLEVKNAFGSIDHARLLAIMADLGYQQDAINLIGNIFSNYPQYFLDHILAKLNQHTYKEAPYKETHSAHTSL